MDIMAEIVGEKPGEPLADGRGKSPGSQKHQFRAGPDLRRGVRRKAKQKPNPMLLLKRIRRAARKGDLKVFESRLAELELVLGRHASLKNQVQGKPIRTRDAKSPIRRPDSKPVQESNPPTTAKGLPERRKGLLVKVCPGCRGRVDFDLSLLEPGTVLHHDCGARVRVGSNGCLNWF